MVNIENDPSNKGRRVYLPLAKLSKCALCDVQDAPDKKLRLCTACGETAYCSPECQKADWANHKILCGKTDRVEIQSFYPLLASIISVHNDLSHPAFTHQIINDPNPGSGDIIKLPNGDAAKLVVLGDPIRQKETSTAKWWPAAVSPTIRSKLFRRILAEGAVLPTILAMAVGLVSEMYTTTALSASEESDSQVTGKRRVRLTHKRSPISDIGIIAGTVRVSPQDRLVYFSQAGDIMMGQDPADHYWLYFTTLSGEELYLDCGVYTFNFSTTVSAHPYCQYGLPDLTSAPAFWFGRENQEALPLAAMDKNEWKPRKRFSILREQKLERIVRRPTVHPDDAPILHRLMDDIAGRPCTWWDKRVLLACYASSSKILRLNMENRSYLNFPKEPSVTVDMDPDEKTRNDEGQTEYQEVDAAYLAKLGRKVKNDKITLEQWRNAFEAWTKKPVEVKIRMWNKPEGFAE